MNTIRMSQTFPEIAKTLHHRLIIAPTVNVGEWQSQAGGIEAQTVELEDVTFHFQLPPSIELLQEIIKPNLPWAEEHFAERISRIAYNPPPSAERWPFKRDGHAEHLLDGRFSHTYPERFWPNYGERVPQGIRFRFGDLDDVLNLLIRSPHTRQAYLPIWFPEDTGTHHGERVPCTLGYHFMLRNGELKVVYYMRSCDFLRHFRDDVYLAGRLCQWLAGLLSLAGPVQVVPGRLVMHISSLHVFERDVHTLVYRRNTGRF